MAGISRVVLRGCGLPIPAGSNRGHETAADAALACSKPRRGPTPAWTACPCGTEQRALVLRTILRPGRSLRRSRMMRTQHAGLRRRRLRPADPCGIEFGATDRHDARQSPARRSLRDRIVRHLLSDRNRSTDRSRAEAASGGTRVAALRRGAAAGCRPLRGRNPSAYPSARQQQCSEFETQLAKRTHDADASCGPSPPKAAARRSLRNRVRRDRPTRRPAKPGPPSLPKSGLPSSYLIRSLSLRSW